MNSENVPASSVSTTEQPDAKPCNRCALKSRQIDDARKALNGIAEAVGFDGGTHDDYDGIVNAVRAFARPSTPEQHRDGELLDEFASVAHIATDPGPFGEDSVADAQRRLPDLRTQLLARLRSPSGEPTDERPHVSDVDRDQLLEIANSMYGGIHHDQAMRVREIALGGQTFESWKAARSSRTDTDKT